MDNNNEELEKDLKEQYAMLESEMQEDKKNKRFLLLLVAFLSLFLIMFGTTFSYFRIFRGEGSPTESYSIKDLYIDGHESDFKFDPNVYYYVLRVEEGTTSVDIKYSFNCQKCRVVIEGNENLKPGENVVKVTFIDPYGNETEYIIYVIVGEPVDSSTFGLESLSASNHSLDKAFDTAKTLYIVHNISSNEDVVNVDFKLLPNTTLVGLKLNGSPVTRPVIDYGDYSRIYFNVQSELAKGANKLEIVTKDANGNTKTYIVYLVVEEPTVDVVQIGVEYFENVNGKLNITGITPGWKSPSKQHIRITNGSNYDVAVRLDWTEVSNNFTNKDDLVYTLYKGNTVVKTGVMPSEDTVILPSMEISANSVSDYYIEYDFKYKEPTEGYTPGDPEDPNNQNIDQGKEFYGVLKVSLQK